MRTRTTLAAVAAAAALLTACGARHTSTTPDAKPDETVTAATEIPEAAAEETPEDTALGLTDTVTYDNKISISLSGFTRGISSEWAAPGNMPYVRFTISVTNGGESVMDLNEMSVLCQYGDSGKEGEQIFDSDKGLDGTPTTHLRPGRSIDVPIACELPKSETYAQIEVTPNMETETAIFAGNVK